MSNIIKQIKLKPPGSSTEITYEIGVKPNNIEGLLEGGYISPALLPSYVDEIIEGYYINSKFYSSSAATNEIPGESGKIYVDLSTGTDKDKDLYRWSGSQFVKIVDIPDLTKYYTRTEIDQMEFITVNDIDTICNSVIENALINEVRF